MRILILTAFIFMAGASAARALPSTASSHQGDQDFLCVQAPEGMVAEVPPPFNLWLMVVCPAQGQALVPVEGMVWRARGTDEQVSILALPPDSAPVQHEADYDPRYRVRFKSLLAAEVTGEKAVRVKFYLARALGGAKAEPFERIFQLDAVSSIYDLRYNIYFYVRDKKPVMGLVCLDQCRQAMLMDIVSVKKDGKRVSLINTAP